MPTPSTVPGPQTPDYAGTEKQLFSDWQKSQAGVEQAYKTTEPAVTAARSEVTKAAGAPLPEAPKLQDIPQYQPRQNVQQDLNEFAGVLSFFGALASLRTREPLTSALNSAGAAMEGLHKGQLDQAKLDMEQFDKQMASAIAENKKNLDQYNAIIQAHNLSISQKQSMLSVAAAARDDAVAMATVQQHGVEGMIKLVDTMQRTGQAAQDRADRLKEQMRHNLEVERLKAIQIGAAKGAANAQATGLTPYARDLAGINYLFTGTLPFLGFGGSGGNARLDIINAAGEASKAMGLSPQQAASFKFDIKAQQQALNFMTKWGSGVQRSEDTVLRNGEVMLDYAKRLGLTDIQHLNKLIVAGQKEFGSPDAQAYANAATTVMNEYARVMSGPMSNAQLHVTATQTAENMINSSMSIDQLEATLNIMQRDMANQMASTNDTIEGLRSRMSHLDQGSKPAFDIPKREKPHTFGSEQEAEAAAARGEIKPGDRITVGGQSGVWQ